MLIEYKIELNHAYMAEMDALIEQLKDEVLLSRELAEFLKAEPKKLAQFEAEKLRADLLERSLSAVQAAREMYVLSAMYNMYVAGEVIDKNAVRLEPVGK